MKENMSILPNEDQIIKLLEWPEDTQVCIVNILRFKDGKESAYKNYSREAVNSYHSNQFT